jgi:uncharacterized protein
MHVVVAGASGLIGSALVPVLRERGHEVTRLVRRSPEAGDERHWDPAAGILDAASLADADAVVNVAGVNLGQRWSQTTRERILSSRVDTTRLLATTVAGLPGRPALVCASAVGFYGDGGSVELTEESPKGDGFLADVVEAWEAAAQPAREAGVRTVHLRQGIVLSAEGGAIAKMLTPFRLGLGGRVGSGEQYWSWISLSDVVAVYVWALEGDVDGIVNAVAPQQVTSAEFTKALGRVLGRPTVFPLPAFAVRALFGAMGDETLLAGQRALPTRLEQESFTFVHPDVVSGLRSALGREA